MCIATHCSLRRFEIIHKCDRQTDRRSDTSLQHTPRLNKTLRGKDDVLHLQKRLDCRCFRPQTPMSTSIAPSRNSLNDALPL